MEKINAVVIGAGVQGMVHVQAAAESPYVDKVYICDPDVKRFELRNPDATCNPYLAYAAILMAGLDGVKNKIDPKANGWGPYDFNLYTLSDEGKYK